MPDPRAQFSRQYLLYAATALRAEAHRLEQSASDPQYGSTCKVFRTSAATTRELAEKFDRIAAYLAAPRPKVRG